MIFSGNFLPLTAEKMRDKSTFAMPTMYVQFVVKSVCDIIEGTKCMAMHMAHEQKTIFAIIRAMLCILLSCVFQDKHPLPEN